LLLLLLLSAALGAATPGCKSPLPLTASLPLLLESAGRSDTYSTEQRPKSQEVTSQPLATRVMNHDWGS
jgi:hypothetical protein